MTTTMDRMTKKKNEPPKDRHIVPKSTLRMPSHYGWLLKLLGDVEDRDMSSVVMRLLRPEFKRIGLWPLPDDVVDEISKRKFTNLKEFKAFLTERGLWPVPSKDSP